MEIILRKHSVIQSKIKNNKNDKYVENINVHWHYETIIIICCDQMKELKDIKKRIK